MKKPLALAALAAMILVGAAYPDSDKPDAEEAGYADRNGHHDDNDDGGRHDRDDMNDRDDDYADLDDSDRPREYRACRDANDDNCIQLHERGVRASYARWLDDGDPDHQPVRMANVGERRPYVARAAHRGRHAARSHHRWQRMHHAARPTRHHGRRHAQARSHYRQAFVSTRTRCAPVARRPAARPAAARVARAAPPPVRRPAPPAHQRRPADSGVRGM